MLKMLKKLLRLPVKKYDKRIRMLRQLRDGIFAFQELAAQQAITEEQPNPRTAAVIFSKDRPLQLELLLHSIDEFIRPVTDIHIIYHCDNDAYTESYHQLAQEYQNKTQRFIFHPQTNHGFKHDLLNLLGHMTDDRVFFLVDDIVFTRPTNLTVFNKYDLYRFIPSLRLGKNLSFCYALDQKQPLPALTQISNDQHCWQWHNADYDWKYPLSVDGHIFPRKLILKLSEIIDYTAPNTYESKLQVFREIFLPLNGICFTHSCMVNIPCNKVQNEESKNRSGDINPEQLHQIFRDGGRIDLQPLNGFDNNSVHQQIPFEIKPSKPQS